MKIILAVLAVFWLPVLSGAAAAPESDVIITSDQMELFDNGARTVFTGHVVVEQGTYRLKADRMIQEKATGVIEARGHVEGLSLSATGEKLLAVGNEGRYNPNLKTTELWDHPRLTHWQTRTDTAPVVATALYFIYNQNNRTLRAQRNVRIEQEGRLWTRSDEANYEQDAQVVHLWGEQRTIVHYAGDKDQAHFFCDRALIYLSPKRTRLIDHVQGRVGPG